MGQGRTSGGIGVAAVAAAVAAGCLGVPDMATESLDGSALSADGKRMRLIYRNRGWAQDRESYELYSRVPYVSSGSVTIMGMRLALPARWDDNTPVSLITMDTQWWADAELGLALFHRPEGSASRWEPLRCATAGGVAGADLQYFHASQALIDLQAGEVELVPVTGAGTGGTGFERSERSFPYDEGLRPTTVSTFAQCGIAETNPEFSAFVFPYSADYWAERFDYDFAAACDGDPCPAYRGDPNEPRQRGNGGVPWGNNNNGNNWNNNNGNNNWNNNNGGIADPYRAAWDVTDDSMWQCGRTNIVGQGNVTSARVEIRGRHARVSELEATLKKVGGMTNVPVFSTNSGLYFPISRSVATSNELRAGTWELCVRDTVRGEMGRVDGWSLTLDQAAGGAGLGGGAQPGVVAVTAGVTRNDSLEENASDWYSIALTQGQTLTVSTGGSCTDDEAAPVLSVHTQLPLARPTWGLCPGQGDNAWNTASTLACVDDDDGDYCTRLETRAPSTGTYYVRVVPYENDYAGTYSITFGVR